MNRDTNKVALVTGASSGIGRALALGFARDAWKVLAVARRKQELEQLEKEGQGRVLGVVLDVSNESEVREVIKCGEEKLGPISVAINNAAINYRGTLELGSDKLEELFSVNVFGAWNIARAIVPRFKERSKGYLFNISSVAGKTAFPESGAYCASKFALQALNEALHEQLKPSGIKVTAICPSWTATPMAHYSHLPAEQMIQPTDIYRTVSFLLSLGAQVAVKEIVLDCSN